MITDYDLKPHEVEKIDRELQQIIGVETHPPFLQENFSDLFMETETSA